MAQSTLLIALRELGFKVTKVTRGTYASQKGGRVNAVRIKGVGTLYRTEITDFIREQEALQDKQVYRPLTAKQLEENRVKAYNKALDERDVARKLAKAKQSETTGEYAGKYGKVSLSLTKISLKKFGAKETIKHLDNIMRLNIGLAYDANVELEGRNIVTRGQQRESNDLVAVGEEFIASAGRMTEKGLGRAIQLGYSFDNGSLDIVAYIENLKTILAVI